MEDGGMRADFHSADGGRHGVCKPHLNMRHPHKPIFTGESTWTRSTEMQIPDTPVVDLSCLPSLRHDIAPYGFQNHGELD